MSVAAQFETDLLAAFPTLPGVVPAVYRPKAGGDAVDTHAMVQNEQREIERTATGWFAELRIPIRDVPEPRADDVFEFGGVSWQVRPSTDQFIAMRKSWPFWILRCRREVHPSLKGGA